MFCAAAVPWPQVLLRGGEAAALFLGPIPDDKLPKDATAGAWCMCSLASRCL